MLAAVGGIICLDRTQALQFMISRPLAIGILYGVAAQDLAAGLVVALAFEFLYAGRLPVGSHVPPSDTLGALGAAGLLYLQPAGQTSLVAAGVAIALSIPLAEWGRGVDIWVRKANGHLAAYAERRVQQGQLAIIDRVHWIALLISSSVYALSLLVFYLIGDGVMASLLPIDGWLAEVFTLFALGLPLFGFAESVASIDVRRFPRAAALGLVLGIALLWAGA
jgi:mannose/fructose/N-acetylgalactosamine-specific phosphotransferase system component IIC